MGSVSLELTNAAWPLVLYQSKDLCLLILDYTWFRILGLSLSIQETSAVNALALLSTGELAVACRTVNIFE